MMKKIELIILKNLLMNESFARKVLPHLQSEYLQERPEKILYEEIRGYILKYNLLPTPEAISIALQARDNVFEEDFKEAGSILNTFTKEPLEDNNIQWLSEITEKWCQERAIHNAIMESINILDDKDGKKQTRGKGAIPKILADALAVSFDPNIGHDYIDDADSRFDFYHRNEQRIPFDLDYFNRITKGGFAKKTLNIILAGTNVGKSMFMCHFAASALSQNYNVLYVTMEMSEEKIAQRIDANLLNVSINDLAGLPKDNYDRKMAKLKSTIKGKLIIKEYPTASAGASNFRHLLNELSLKKHFKPDIIFIDYLNICTSSRLKAGNNVNSYSMIKAIAEELRGIAVEFNVPVVSATQTTRSGYGNSDPGLEDTSESFGLPATADFMFAAITSEELEKANLIQIKQLKNRDNDVTLHKRFVIGIDRSKMRLCDVEEDKQQSTFAAPSPSEIYKSVGKKEKDETVSIPNSLMDDTNSVMGSISKNFDRMKDWTI